MQLAQKRDIQRAAFSAAVALTLHALIFLAVELAHLFRFESEGPAYGAMFVDITDLKPDAALTVRPPTPPVVVPKTPPPATPAKETPGSVLAVEDPKAPAETTPSKTVEKTPTPIQPAPPVNRYSAKDSNGATLGVEMGNKSDIAKPNWRSQIILPKWVLDQKIKLFVVFSFVVDKEGFLSTEPVIVESSGFSDVDEAVKRSLINRGIKFTNPTDANMVGKYTYQTNP